MAYTKTVWASETGTDLNRFTKTEETGSSVKLTRNPSSIIEAGTPFSVAHMNNIENEIEGIANLDYTFGGDKIFGGKVTISSSGLTSSSSSIELQKETFVNNLLNIKYNVPILRFVETDTGAEKTLVLSDNHLSLRRTGTADLQTIFWDSGNVGIGSNYTDNGTDLLQVGSDSDISVSMGRGKIFGLGDVMYLSHYDFATTSNYALYQSTGGRTSINAPTGNQVDIRNNNLTLATFGASSIELKKETIINSTSRASSDGNAGTGTFKLVTGTGASTDEALIMGVEDGVGSWISAIKPGTAQRLLSLNPEGGKVALGGDTTINGSLSVDERIVINRIDDGITDLQVGGDAVIDGSLKASKGIQSALEEHSDTLNEAIMFTNMAGLIPTVGDKRGAKGSIFDTANSKNWVLSKVLRFSSTEIDLYCMDITSNTVTIETLSSTGTRTFKGSYTV